MWVLCFNGVYSPYQSCDPSCFMVPTSTNAREVVLLCGCTSSTKELGHNHLLLPNKSLKLEVGSFPCFSKILYSLCRCLQIWCFLMLGGKKMELLELSFNGWLLPSYSTLWPFEFGRSLKALN